MGYRVSGILKLPDGSPAANAELEFISRKNFSPLVQELKSNIKCSATGAYDVTLEYGEYAVIVYPGGTYPAALGTIILAADTVAGKDLPTLLQQADWQPATPEYIQQIAQWIAEADASASAALASELAAKASENNAKESEVAAESNRAEVAAKSASVDAKHSEVVSKAAIVDTKTAQVIAAESVAVAAADTASQKASDAASHEAVSLDAAARAENAALSMVGAIIDGGECDLSGGVYPQPVSASGITYSTVWFVAVGGTVSGVTYDAGDQLRYTTANSGYYFKVDAKDDVYSVNGEKGAVTVTPEKIGAEVSGTASQLVTQHEAKLGAHQISGVAGLREELDAMASASGGISAINDRLVVVEGKVEVLGQRKSTCLVNAVGTGAPHETVSATLPANIAANTRYVLANPFGDNVPVSVFAQLYANGVWADPGWDGNSQISDESYGARASYVPGVGIVIQTGTAGAVGKSIHTGGGHNTSSVVASAPCRVFVRKLET